jgi:hypothetical protein
MKLEILPVTSDLWPALEDLFGERGACNGCWCMYWRIGADYRKRPRERNRLALREIVKRGPPPGLIAFDGDVAVGWCQLTPRSALPWLDRTWRLKRVDDVEVWSPSSPRGRSCATISRPSHGQDPGGRDREALSQGFSLISQLRRRTRLRNRLEFSSNQHNTRFLKDRAAAPMVWGSFTS